MTLRTVKSIVVEWTNSESLEEAKKTKKGLFKLKSKKDPHWDEKAMKQNAKIETMKSKLSH